MTEIPGHIVNNESPSINILPADQHGDILVQLIRGQERAAAQIEMQNTRLFGGNGQVGVLPRIMDQHDALGRKIDAVQMDVGTRIDSAKNDLLATIDARKASTDQDIKDLDTKQDALDTKVSRFLTIGATVNSILLAGLAALGIYHKAH